MDVSEYLVRCIRNPDYSLPVGSVGNLVLDPQLSWEFRRMRDRAEHMGMEIGCRLLMRDRRLLVGVTILGTKTNVPLETPLKSVTLPTYIGNFHAHPYLRKMGPLANIGPSTGDLEIWLQHRPRNFPISIHFVFGGEWLYALVFRQGTRSLNDNDAREELINGGCSSDVGMQMEYLGQDESRYNIWHQGVNLVNDNDRNNNHDQSITSERDMWDQIPEMAGYFAALNLKMNVAWAEAYCYELYVANVLCIGRSRELKFNRLS